MIIGIDASKMLSTKPTGVEICVSDLIRAVLALDSENTYWLYSPSAIPNLPVNERVKNVIVPNQKFWTIWGLSRELGHQKPDVFWAPSNILPFNLPDKVVVTVHDIAPRLFPKIFSLRTRFLSYWVIKQASKIATKIIAVSQQTKRDLKKYFGIAGEKVEVIYHALRSDFKPMEIDVSAIYPELGDRYFIYVGRIELQKNLPNLIKAFAEFKKSDKEGIKLLLGGRPGFGYQSIMRLIKKLNLSTDIIIKDYIPSDHLSSLYNHAIALVYPSLYEGFGLNILEGFASKVPVITSNLGATAEIAGGSAYLVDPTSVKDIALGFAKLSSDNNLRNALIAKGQTRLQDFSWEKSAAKLINLWRTL